MKISKRVFLLSFFSAIIFFIYFEAFPQEIAVPFDSQGKLKSIGEEQNRKLSLFTGYDKFIEAKLFQISDSSFALEIYYIKNNEILKDRKLLGYVEFIELRTKIDTTLSKLSYTLEEPDQEGRIRLIITSIGLSLGFYGWAVPTILDVSNPIALYTTIGALGFIVPYALTTNKFISRSEAMLFYYGGTRGIIHGFFLAEFLDLGDDNFFGDIDHYLTFATILSFTEAIGGFGLAHNGRLKDGTAGLIQVFGDFGLLGGLAISYVFELDNQGAGLLTLLSSFGGNIVGFHTAKKRNYTYGDDFVIETSGYLGAYLGSSITQVLNNSTSKTQVLSGLLWGLASTAFTHFKLMRDVHFTTAQGILTQLGTIGFGLLGAGIGYSAFYRSYKNEKFIMPISALTGVAGFAIFYNSFAKAQKPAHSKSSFNINFNPQSLLLGITNNQRFLLNYYLPILSVSYKF